MSVYDRWHKSHPGPDDEPCKEHSRGKTKLYPTAEHGQGDRWQVRWRDENGKQCKRNFTKREGTDPDEQFASAFDAQVQVSLDVGLYVDPRTGDSTFEEYAEEWRRI